MQNLSNSEIKVTEVISFILEQYRNEKLWMQAKLSYHEFK